MEKEEVKVIFYVIYNEKKKYIIQIEFIQC